MLGRAAYLFFNCGQQDAVGGGGRRGLRPLFDHLGGNPDQTRHLQTEQDLGKGCRPGAEKNKNPISDNSKVNFTQIRPWPRANTPSLRLGATWLRQSINQLMFGFISSWLAKLTSQHAPEKQVTGSSGRHRFHQTP